MIPLIISYFQQTFVGDESLVLSKSLKDYSSLVKFSFLIPSVGILAVSPSVISMDMFLFLYIQEETDINFFEMIQNDRYFCLSLICKRKHKRKNCYKKSIKSEYFKLL